MRNVEREINPGWQKNAEKCGYPKTIQLLNNISLKFIDQNNFGPINKAHHWINQGNSQCPREDMELLAPVFWREVKHPKTPPVMELCCLAHLGEKILLHLWVNSWHCKAQSLARRIILGYSSTFPGRVPRWKWNWISPKSFHWPCGDQDVLSHILLPLHMAKSKGSHKHWSRAS